MSIARFSPFELLLLKSRSQVDTATLLLLAWVLVHRQHVSEGQRRRRLAQVTAQFRHGHELGPVMSIARSQDLQAIQLAAEVVRKECGTERSLSVIHQAITVATDDGELSLANHYILRFLADLLSIAPMTLNTLFKELTGTPLATPEDPSRDAYWQAHDPDYHARKAREAEAAEQYHQQANARAEQQQQQKERRHQQKQQKQQEKQQRQEQARQAREQEQQRQREQTRQQEQERQRQQQQREQAERERRRSRQQDSRHQHRQQEHRQQRASPPPDRTTRALSVLGLTPGATRVEVRHAYRRMAQLHHPDRFYSESEQQVALASARFQRIKNAYDYLMQTY
ncbi:J domain-containing protein [Vreelandella titanicae]|jgi:flagellar biosynthesis GTPase FlhF|uniref:J domain-containing protein n=1 Tax=Halomonadaceae TaxID=28256 RepID=UPI00034C5DD3|nr:MULTISPECIES: J domain-containing protein [Halomonas]NAO96434.1 DnaJ domain-containing protein [Halomonas sp. MG34]UEQ05296.1 J domain-containing protein [Halomonas profundus]KIN16036.1 molecular chaperone DnaJ [Halomonas sp. KHS3]MCD1588225.1 J domain-containing protein [Halomonas sp. IOP_14]MCE7516860.1 J domain-containing protein [Halomonas titanicae]|tara:strand:+ start:1062 stop:2081 length:1020 start_codon:yes stop_codon:yes gene_type:complete